MKNFLAKNFLALLLVALLAAASPAFAVNVNIDGLPAAGSVAGTDLLECEQGGVNRKCTAAQTAAYVNSLFSGDFTAAAGGAATFATVNGNIGSFGSATQCVSITVNAKGLVTAASAATCAPAIGSVTGLGSGIATFLGTPSSANLLAALTTKTGTGNAVFGTAPTIDSLNATTALTLAFLTGSTQCLQVNTSGLVSGTGAACGGAGSTGANPTATAGPTAVNGVATTFLRSDGAPAVQQGSAAQKGIVQVDGTTINASAGVINAVNIGTVTSVATSCGVTGGTITATGTVKAIATPNAQVGTSYTVVDGDCGKAVTLSNAAAVAVSIGQAGAGGFFASGWFSTIINLGVGTVTITPTTSTIDGAASLTLATNQSIDLISDGTNYFTARGRATGGGGTPGGADTQIQFNSSGAFAGDSGFTYGGGGQVTHALGTITTNKQALNITGTFNAAGVAFTPILMNITNTASAAATNLMNLQIASTSIFAVRKDAMLTFATGGTGVPVMMPVGGGTFSSTAGLAFWDTTLPSGVASQNMWFGGTIEGVSIWGSGVQFDRTFSLSGTQWNLQSGLNVRWYNNFIGGGSPDTGLTRNAAGVVEANNSTAGTLAEFKSRSWVAGGSVPTPSGSCPVNTQLGGNTAGSFKANGACAAGTVILTFGFTAANGWSCDAHDLTTPADLMNQTAYTTTTVTFTGTMANLDLVTFKCVAF